MSSEFFSSADPPFPNGCILGTVGDCGQRASSFQTAVPQLPCSPLRRAVNFVGEDKCL